MKCLITAATLLALTFSAASFAQADKVYRWTDAEGVMHFSTSPPPANQPAEEITLDRGPTLAVEETQPAAATEEMQDPDAQRAEIIARNCQTARQNLSRLETAESAIRTDPDTGEQVEIHGEDLQQAVRTSLEQIREFCVSPNP